MSYIETIPEMPKPITGVIVGVLTEHYNRTLEVMFEYEATAVEWAKYLKYAKRQNGLVLVTLSLLDKDNQ